VNSVAVQHSIDQIQTRVDQALCEEPVSIRHRRVFSPLPREGDPERAESEKQALRDCSGSSPSASNCPAFFFGSLDAREERVGRSNPPLESRPISAGAQFARRVLGTAVESRKPPSLYNLQGGGIKSTLSANV
jgi:hypothetical protein